MSLAAIGAALSLGVLVYVYLGYPVLLWVIGRLRHRPVAHRPIRPHVTVLIPVHNEEDVIEEKVLNTLASEYPPERLEVLILSDGSTDGTVKRVRELLGRLEGNGRGGPRRLVRLFVLPREGKGSALNAGARAARGEILVFTDANTLLAPDSLQHLISPFADPEVGGVCGNKRYVSRTPGSTAQGEGAYWRYDRWVKVLESRVGSIFASDGALHAVRSELYRPIRNPASADDMAISMRVVLQGHRLVYAPEAVVMEEPPHDPGDEFRRKIRVTNHSMRALLDLGPALWTSGFYSVELLSHKLVRHLSPLFLTGLVVGSLVAGVGGSTGFRILLLAQAAFYALAGLGHLVQRRGRAGSVLLAVPYHFVLIQIAALAGIASILRGHRLRTWTPRGGLEAGGTP
jgi:cellulose synthase/poly-beta-1,6-N-acetylglucosamine synthase-like glycosyltransferase